MSQRSYLSIKWIHTHKDEPILLVLELDADRMELRKIEYFLSGAVGLASNGLSRNGSELSSEPIPSVQKINSDRQFQAKEIDKADFEAQWSVYV